MDLSDMDDADAAALVQGKRVAVVGSGKSAFDIAAECADANGESVALAARGFLTPMLDAS